MAELLLKIDVGSGYEDGDILCAFNRRAIRCVHAQQICHVKTAPRNSSGLISLNSLARDWFNATHQYRFERIDSRRVRRRNLATDEVETLSDVPNERGEAIDVGLFVRRRKQNPNHLLFNVDGREIWYGGRKDYSDAALDVVWSAIESKSEHREENFSRWPAGAQELKSHLFIETDEFDDATANELVLPDTDDSGEERVIINKRKHQVPLDRLGRGQSDLEKIRDKSQSFDLRGVQQFQRANIVRTKSQER